MTGLTFSDRLGRAIAIRRAELRMGRRELAHHADLSYPYVSEIENGVKMPSHRALERIAGALGMRWIELEIAALSLDPEANPSVIVLAAEQLVERSIDECLPVVHED